MPNRFSHWSVLLLVGAITVGWPCAGSQLFAQDADSSSNEFSAAIDAAQARTVKIYGAGIGRSKGYATGIIVSGEGDILTAQGVFLAAGNLRVGLPDGTIHDATVTRRNNALQAALIKIEAKTPQFFELSRDKFASTGDWAIVVGNAFKVAEGNEPLAVNLGVLSTRTKLNARRGLQDVAYDGEVYLLDAITSNPGAAGGAVVNTDGKLIGMVGKVVEGKAGGARLNFAVPADLLAPFVAGEEPETTPSVPTNPPLAEKGDLGIRLFALGGRKGPAYIDRVIPGSPAAAAGLKTDDLVVSLGGQAVHDSVEFKRLTDLLKVGQEIVLEVKRKEMLLRFTLVPIRTIATGAKP